MNTTWTSKTDGNVTRHHATIDGLAVRIDEINGHVGFGYSIGDRAFTAAGFASVGAAKRSLPRHIKRTRDAIERARLANAERMRNLRTIGQRPSDR